MTRFSGKVGYAKEVRIDGVVETIITERIMKGDVKRNVRYFANTDSVLGKVSYQTRIEVMADAHALENENYLDIRFVELDGGVWEVDTVQPERPRLILAVGSKYNGPRESDNPETEDPDEQ